MPSFSKSNLCYDLLVMPVGVAEKSKPTADCLRHKVTEY